MRQEVSTRLVSVNVGDIVQVVDCCDNVMCNYIVVIAHNALTTYLISKDECQFINLSDGTVIEDVKHNSNFSKTLSEYQMLYYLIKNTSSDYHINVLSNDHLSVK